jgi:hypothetical protein
MPQSAWSAKRERQYEHIKEGEKKQGRSTKRAKEIAARTVNKERARSGESKTRSRTSTRDMSSYHRGGLRSGTRRPKGPDEGAALQRGQAAQHPRPLAHEQSSAATRGGCAEVIVAFQDA